MYVRNQRKTGLKPIATLSHKCNIINEEHFEAIWNQTMYLCGVHNFEKLRASKGGDLLLCNDTDFDLGSIQTGRANVKTTASLLYKFFDATGPVWMHRLTNMCSKTSALCFTP